MTLVVLWCNSDTELPAIECASDTRISRAGDRVTDSGRKLFVLEMVCSGSEDQQVRHSLGICFAGSVIFCNSVVQCVSSIARELYSLSAPHLPSLLSMGDLVRRVCVHFIRTWGVRDPATIDFKIEVFGFCPIMKKLQTVIVENSIDKDGVFDAKMAFENDFFGKKLLSFFGSGNLDFLRIMAAAEKSGQPISPITGLVKVIEERGASVGGSVQYIRADATGAKFMPVIRQDETSPDRMKREFIGLNTLELYDDNKIEGLDIGSSYFVVGMQKYMNRHALRDSGIDPDDPSLTQGDRNRAAFEAMITHMSENDVPGNLSADRISFSPPAINESKTYLKVKCWKCGCSQEVFEDRTNGCFHEVKERFRGHGSYAVHCRGCTKSIEFNMSQVFA